LKIPTSTVLGLLAGAAVALVGMGKVNGLNPEIVMRIHDDVWWVVVLSMLVPLADYLTGVRTTLLGVVAGHPFRHLAGFFTGLAVGLGFLLLLSARL